MKKSTKLQAAYDNAFAQHLTEGLEQVQEYNPNHGPDGRFTDRDHAKTVVRSGHGESSSRYDAGDIRGKQVTRRTERASKRERGPLLAGRTAKTLPGERPMDRQHNAAERAPMGRPYLGTTVRQEQWSKGLRKNAASRKHAALSSQFGGVRRTRQLRGYEGSLASASSSGMRAGYKAAHGKRIAKAQAQAKGIAPKPVKVGGKGWSFQKIDKLAKRKKG